MPKIITKIIQCPNPRCPSRASPLSFQVVFKKFQNSYAILCPHCGNPIYHSERWNFEFTDKRDYNRKRKPLYNRTPSGKASIDRYWESPKGRATRRKAQDKFNKSDKGRIVRARHGRKRYHTAYPNAKYIKRRNP